MFLVPLLRALPKNILKEEATKETELLALFFLNEICPPITEIENEEKNPSCQKKWKKRKDMAAV